MALYAPPFPWLSKPAVVRSATELIVQSALAAHAAVAYLDFAGAARARRRSRTGSPPQGRGAASRSSARQADAAQLRRAAGRRSSAGSSSSPRFRSELSSGTFIFVISDFLGSPLADSAVLGAAARRWEVVPVIVQDPTWEQSFPLVGPLVLPLARPGRRRPARGSALAPGGARPRAATTSGVRASSSSGSALLGLDPVLLETRDADGDRPRLPRLGLDGARDLRLRR